MELLSSVNIHWRWKMFNFSWNWLNTLNITLRIQDELKSLDKEGRCVITKHAVKDKEKVRAMSGVYIFLFAPPPGGGRNMSF